MLMTLVTKVVNVRLFLYGAALARVNTTTTPVRMAGLNGARCEGGRLGPRCRGAAGGAVPGPLPWLRTGPRVSGCAASFLGARCRGWPLHGAAREGCAEGTVAAGA